MAFESYYKLVKYKTPPELLPFYVEDVSGSANTVSITKSDANAPTLTIETSTDRTTWTTAGTTSTTALNISVPANGRVYIRCSATKWALNYERCTLINSIGNVKVGGNIMSLLYGSNFTGNETVFPNYSSYTFVRLFHSNSHLTDISQLIMPATTLAESCYNNMFYGCTALTTAPALPATTLTDYCYQSMFNGCTSLTTAPTLSATTLAESCYASMFNGCTSLTTAPTLSATTLASYCYQSMFSNCTSLTTAPALPATTLAQYCYQYMFQNCTSLTTAPALNAITLATGCYKNMFHGCTHLNSITCLATDISASDCTNSWLYNVAASGTFTKAASMSSWTTGASGIPSGWTIQNA